MSKRMKTIEPEIVARDELCEDQAFDDFCKDFGQDYWRPDTWAVLDTQYAFLAKKKKQTSIIIDNCPECRVELLLND